MQRTAIIGFGCAGFHAAKSMREHGYNGEIHIYSNTDTPPANPMLTTYYVTGTLAYGGMFPFGDLDTLREEYDLILHRDTLVTALDSAQRRLTLRDGRTAFFDNVVLATGASPREMGLPGEQELRGRGVAYCATCDGMMYRNKTVAVLGGGNSAVADALYLSKLCREVYLIHRRDTLRASKVYMDALKDSGIQILWNSRAVGLLRDKRVSGLVLEDVRTGARRELACEGIFVAIGRVPDTELFRGQVELDEQGYIKADETTRTGLPGVFAVGDVRTKPLRQIVTATADGATASHFIEQYLMEENR